MSAHTGSKRNDLFISTDSGAGDDGEAGLGHNLTPVSSVHHTLSGELKKVALGKENGPLLAASPNIRSALLVTQKGAKMKLDELFFVWLSDEKAQETVRQLVRNSAAGSLLPSSNSSPVKPAPPLSPKGRGQQKSLRNSPRRSPTRAPSSPSTLSRVQENPVSKVLNLSEKSPGPDTRKAKADLQEQSGKAEINTAATGDGSSSSSSTTSTPAKGSESSIDAPSRSSSPSLPAPTAPVTAKGASLELIPRFHFPGAGGRGRGKAIPADSLQQRSESIAASFREYPSGMSHENFVAVTKDLCNLPSFFSTPLHKRVRAMWAVKNAKSPAEAAGAPDTLSEEGLVTEEMFRSFWKSEIEPFDRYSRFFRLLKRPNRNYIFPSDFEPFLKELLKYHPGLEFLESAPEFQDKYMRTVVARIFYSTDRYQRWRLSERDVRRSNPSLLDAFDAVDENDDINVVHNFFSYEHFYVLYCKFWELDTDRDFMITQEDLLRYGGHALTRRAIERVFEQAGRQFLCTSPGKMGYEDFCFFMLAEEDKSTLESIKYWFSVVDLNSDGAVTPEEMKVFYDEQLHRMECLGHELVPFDDIYSQLCDLVGLSAADGFAKFELKDFTRGGVDHMMLTGNFFNMLFNLNKVSTIFLPRCPSSSLVTILHFTLLTHVYDSAGHSPETKVRGIRTTRSLPSEAAEDRGRGDRDRVGSVCVDRVHALGHGRRASRAGASSRKLARRRVAAMKHRHNQCLYLTVPIRFSTVLYCPLWLQFLIEIVIRGLKKGCDP